MRFGLIFTSIFRLLLVTFLVSTSPLTFAQNCELDFIKLRQVKPADAQVTKKTIIVAMDKMADIPVLEKNSLLQKLELRGKNLKNRAHQIALQNEAEGIKYFDEVGAQVPKEGYVRALSVAEVKNILNEGGIGSFYDFNFRDQGARVGHGGNFIFLLCRNCSTHDFHEGALGSSVLNNRKLRLDELELIVPYIPQ